MNDEHLNQADCEHYLKVWYKLKFKNLGCYSYLYNALDVVVEFRNVYLHTYKLTFRKCQNDVESIFNNISCVIQIKWLFIFLQKRLYKNLPILIMYVKVPTLAINYDKYWSYCWKCNYETWPANIFYIPRVTKSGRAEFLTRVKTLKYLYKSTKPASV